MSLGVLRPRNKALRDNIDQNYEVLLLYYSNRSRSLVCCTFTCELPLSCRYVAARVFFIHYNGCFICFIIAIYSATKIIPMESEMSGAGLKQLKHNADIFVQLQF